MKQQDLELHLVGREARLFPSFRIRNEREAEVRATASLMAVVMAVQEFGRRMVQLTGGPAGRLTTYTEIPFILGEKSSQKNFRPDGMIRTKRGSRIWTALVEAKVGHNPLTDNQVGAYHQLAGQEGFDCLITISNQPRQNDGKPPVQLDGRRLRKVPVVHLSWERILAEAQMLSRQKAISDPDQSWMLDEWIRYADDPDSKIIEPPDFGKHWHEVVRRASMGQLAPKQAELRDVCECWAGLIWKGALRLTSKLGVFVTPKLSRKHRDDHDQYIDELAADAAANARLAGRLRVPDAIGDIGIEVFIHSSTVRFTVNAEAPSEGRQATRLKWLLRQLQGNRVPRNLECIVRWQGRRNPTQARLDKILDNLDVLLVDERGQELDSKVQPREFELQWTTPLKKSRATARTVEALFADLEKFYRNVVEELVPYTPRAPRLPAKPSESLAGDKKSATLIADDTPQSVVAAAGATTESGET